MKAGPRKPQNTARRYIQHQKVCSPTQAAPTLHLLHSPITDLIIHVLPQVFILIPHHTPIVRGLGGDVHAARGDEGGEGFGVDAGAG